MNVRRMVFVCLVIALALPAAAVSPSGLIAHWPLNGDGTDASGNGNALAISGAVAGSDRLGNPNSAIEMSAPTSSLSLGDGAAADLTTQFTWAGWVRFDRIGITNDGFVSKSCCGTNFSTMFYADTYAWDGSRPHYNQIRFFVAAGGGNYGFENAGPTLQNHTWYHIALVYDGPAQTMKVYVNGLLTNVLTNTGIGGLADVPSSLNDASAPLTMGRLPAPGPSAEMQGALDDVWWFARPLNDAEVAELAGVQTCESLQATIDALTSQNAALSAQNGQLQSEVTALTTQNAQLQGDVATLTSQNGQLQTQVNSLTLQNSQLQGQINTLTTENSQLQGQVTTLTAQNAQLQSQVGAFTQQNAQLQSQVAALMQQSAQLGAQVTAFNSGIASLQSTLQSTFKDPQFAIAGSTPLEQYQNFMTAILNLNQGQLQAIYKALGGK